MGLAAEYSSKICVSTGFDENTEPNVNRHLDVLGALDLPVIATEIERKILYWNHAAEQRYGWATSEMVGTNVADVFARSFLTAPRRLQPHMVK
jgi:PAS domain-containing protein